MIKENMWEQDFIQFTSVVMGLHENTTKSYLSHIRRFLAYLDNREPTKQILESYLYELRQAKRTNHSINTILGALIAYKKYLNERGHSTNFTDGFKTLKVERKVVDVITPDEIKKILNTPLRRKGTGTIQPSDEQFLFFTEMLAYTGARFTEVSKLQVNKIHEDYVWFTETKNNLARKVYLNPIIMKKLKDWVAGRNPEDLVFVTKTGGMMHPGDTLINLRKRFKAAGINKKAYPHVFRHSFATQLAIDGAKPEEIKEILGHKDIQTTLYYVHLADTTIKKATFKHTLNREALSIKAILQDIKDAVLLLNIDRDSRFKVKILEEDRHLTLDIQAR